MASETSSDSAVLTLEGEIDLHASPRVKEQLDPLVARKLPRVIIDMSRVSYIDSSGLALFIEALQRVQAHGGKLSLCGLGPSVRNIFGIARLDQVFTIFPDRTAALAATA